MKLFNKINQDKIKKIYLSITGGLVFTHSIYNMSKAPFKYKQDCIDSYNYKKYKYDSNVERPTINRFIDKPTSFGISRYVMEALFVGFAKGMYMGVIFPITIPSSIYCMMIESDLAELEKIKPS